MKLLKFKKEGNDIRQIAHFILLAPELTNFLMMGGFQNIGRLRKRISNAGCL